MANTKITTNVIADGAITSAKLDTNITISGDITGTLATAAQPNITSLGTLTALTVDDITINGSTISDSGDLTIDTEADLTLTALSDIIHQTTSTNSSAGHHIFKSFNTEIMRIDGGNNRVGIGNNNPDTKLTVGTFGDTARAAAFNGGSILIDGGAASEIIIGDGNVAYMSIQTTDNATAMKIRNFSGNSDLVTIERATGNVGIGETNPDASLHITSNTPIISFDESDAGQEYRIGSFGGSFALYDSTDSAYRLVVDGSGAVGIGVTSILQGYKLEVAGHIVIPSGNFLANRSAGGSNWGLIRGNDSGTTILGDSQSLQITASGNVGIGETTPDDTLHVNNAGGAARIRIGSGNDAYYTQKGYLGDTWVFGSGETGDVVTSTISGGAFTSSNTGGAFVWKIATSGGTPAEKMRIKSDGQITTQGDILPGADVIMANGRGISFAATANSSGSMSNELLDDYEEGTWTPALITSGGVTTTSSTMYGIYTKIGNICHIHAKITATLSSLPGQTFQISGLPFTSISPSDSGQRAIIAIGGDTLNLGGNAIGKAHFRTNGTSLQGVYLNSGSTAYWTYNTMDSTSFELNIHGFYTTT